MTTKPKVLGLLGGATMGLPTAAASQQPGANVIGDLLDVDLTTPPCSPAVTSLTSLQAAEKGAGSKATDIATAIAAAATLQESAEAAGERQRNGSSKKSALSGWASKFKKNASKFGESAKEAIKLETSHFNKDVEELGKVMRDATALNSEDTKALQEKLTRDARTLAGFFVPPPRVSSSKSEKKETSPVNAVPDLGSGGGGSCSSTATPASEDPVAPTGSSGGGGGDAQKKKSIGREAKKVLGKLESSFGELQQGFASTAEASSVLFKDMGKAIHKATVTTAAKSPSEKAPLATSVETPSAPSPACPLGIMAMHLEDEGGDLMDSPIGGDDGSDFWATPAPSLLAAPPPPPLPAGDLAPALDSVAPAVALSVPAASDGDSLDGLFDSPTPCPAKSDDVPEKDIIVVAEGGAPESVPPEADLDAYLDSVFDDAIRSSSPAQGAAKAAPEDVKADADFDALWDSLVDEASASR